MKLIAQKTVPTHIISGFLGAGKTTLLQHLLSQKPRDEVWAVLMNEFGQIGVDQQLYLKIKVMRSKNYWAAVYVVVANFLCILLWLAC